MTGYRCEHCGRSIGLMADVEGNPRPFKCPWTQRVSGPQVPVKRKTNPVTVAGRPIVVELENSTRKRRVPNGEL